MHRSRATTAIMSGKVVVQPTIINFKKFKIELHIPLFTHSSYDVKTDFLMKKGGWTELDTQWLIHKATMVYCKWLNSLAPDNLLKSVC